jgi:general secretion pathway protein D
MKKVYSIILFISLFFSCPLSGWKRRSIVPREKQATLLRQGYEGQAKKIQKSSAQAKHADSFLTQNDAPIPQTKTFSSGKNQTIKNTPPQIPDENAEAFLEKENEANQQETASENKSTKETELTEETKQESKEQKPEEPKDIYLNFENTTLSSFINYMAELRKINLIPHKGTDSAKISLTIRHPLSLSGAWEIFLTIMEMANFSIIEVGDVHKVMPVKQKLTEPLPLYINLPSKDLPDSDITIRYITFLSNIQTKDVQSLLASLLSANHKLISQDHVNGFIITDKAYNIKSAMEVIHELDRSDIQQAVTVMRLKQANAEEVKKLFDQLISKQDKTSPIARLLGRRTESQTAEYFPSSIKIIAEERTNSLILLGDQQSIKKIEDFITEEVDKELKEIKSPLHTYDLKYADVTHIQTILKTMVNDEQGESTAAKTGGVRNGVKYFQKMKFEADKDNNRLVVSCANDQDWKLLKKTIADLDKPQPQVAIETLIVSVNFNDTKSLGGQIRSKKANSLGKNLAFQAATASTLITGDSGTESNPLPNLLGNLFQAVSTAQGTTLLTLGAAQNIWSIFQMLKSQTNTTLISQPFILASNMKPAHLSVGESQYLIKEREFIDGEASGAASYVEAKANLTLDVTPQINLDGITNLDVKVVIEEFGALVGSATHPDKSTKSIDTKASVANGQVLVLGGFVKTKVTDSTYKTPGLGNIPILGWLFKHKRRIISKEYIFIFMAPTIIKPREKPGMNLYTKMKLHQSTDDIKDAINVEKGIDPIHNWFFNSKGETYSHKVVDFANARYQPTSVDIAEDPYYVSKTKRTREAEQLRKQMSSTQEPPEIPPAPQETESQIVTQNQKPEAAPVEHSVKRNRFKESFAKKFPAPEIDDRDLFKKTFEPKNTVALHQERDTQ